MAVLNKLSIAAASTAAFLTLGTFSIDSAQAALFKFNFESEDVNGYFVYDTSVPASRDVPIVAEYVGAITEYKLDLGEKGLYEGTLGNPIVFLVRQGDGGITAPETDDFILEATAEQRGTEFALVTYFSYPKDTFGRSLALPTTIPDTATIKVYPYVNFPDSIGELVLTGTVKTEIEKIPESGSSAAFLGVAGWLMLRRRQHQKNLTAKDRLQA